VRAEDGDGTIWRYRKVAGGGTRPGASDILGCSAFPLPQWLEHQAPVDVMAVLPVSRAIAEGAVPSRWIGSGSAERRKAMARGVLMHRLLASLPDIPQPARTDAARRHLARAGTEFSAQEHEGMLQQVEAILDDPRFRPLFAPGSRSEVPIVGRVAWGGRTLAVSGQVDRLAVTADGVFIADYKTDCPPPRRIEDVPKGYVAQLALYRAVLRLLYPDRPIRAAIVWVDVPELMEIPAARLDAAPSTISLPSP
jgi:ATP-dependent helicase/nuclease subunit A